jgi:hypothetical protein
MTTLAPSLVHALRDKYQTLRALRLQTHEVAPRAELAALAARFPGALRELDRLPLDVIEARLGAIDAVVRGAAEPQSWMRLQVAYHGFMRAALRIRRLLAAAEARAGQDAITYLARIGYTPALDEPALERFDDEALATIAKPPRGRLNPWVIAQVARDHGVHQDLVIAALFHP